MAYKYKEEDMIYSDYSKTVTPGDNPNIIGTPDSDLFNRREIYEVLDLINKLNLDTKEECQQAEKLIHNDLPSNIRSRNRVIEWLIDKLD